MWKCFYNLQDLKQHSHENETHESTTHIKQSREDKHSCDALIYRYEELFQIQMYTKFTTQAFYTTKITHYLQYNCTPTNNSVKVKAEL